MREDTLNFIRPLTIQSFLRSLPNSPPNTSHVRMRVESSLKGPMSPCTTEPFSSRITEDDGGTEMERKIL